MTTKITEQDETRASLYWWFASLFSQELTAEQLKQYRASPLGQGRALLNALAEQKEFNDAANAVITALDNLVKLPHPELELAADFSQLLLTDLKTGAPPYASLYLDQKGLLFQQPHDDMQALLQDQGLRITPDFNEPADHLAIQLDYLGNLILQTSTQDPQAQHQFIQRHLLNWLPQWVTRSRQVRRNGFYPALAQLLLQFIEQDSQQPQPVAAHI
ncbi:molecular chaperone TorD [Motilimonas eburnea]|uniref:molecular chaperone TorD n=1 Tax=Motilimonas eburnea TaxID=1737488 RepID=UPI001E29D2FC|nr:molecular chaperone TorD [Motilimonas eburnea]MCE2571079.1 molecular chaperone TorD [Motilimonas eburnea]